MGHLLTTKRLESFAAHRAQEAEHFCQFIWAKVQSGKPVNLREVLGAFSMNNVTRMLLGKQYFGLQSAGPAWRWLDPYGCEKKMREVEKKVDDFHQKILDEHRRAREAKKSACASLNDDDSKEEMDFVDVLLSLPGENGKEHMDDVEIKALMQDMIAAATDTSSVTNEWVMAEVIKNPHVLRRIQEELDAVVGRGRMVAESDLAHLLYPPVRPDDDHGLPHPGVDARVHQHARAGPEPRIWDDVAEFRPERHLPEEGVGGRVEISHLPDFKILPFSAGIPGAPLGVVLVLMALARHFHCFDWSLPDGLRPEDIDTEEVYGMTMPKAKPLFAVATPRLPPQMYGSCGAARHGDRLSFGSHG
ncbi:cytochrome P450 703A2-like [Phragmites australis]|uniref:cytochrome P450 703A2-like n=1 Tax=Phragmites australis TaxID=29695 RepID=UPI002D78DAAA|nr:cytochrome P450 703A2-like [Phragmites australis]